jgi:hypothetical protein
MSEPTPPRAGAPGSGADASVPPERTAGRAGRLRELLGPRREERRGRGELRFVETAVLLLIGVVLAVATVNDVGRQVHVGRRLAADLASWKEDIGVQSHNPFIEQDVRTYSTRDVVCANMTKGKPLHKTQVCLIFTGPVNNGRRTAKGGFYLLAEGADVHEPVLDRPMYRFACFGSAIAEHLCGLSKPPPVVSTTPRL